MPRPVIDASAASRAYGQAFRRLAELPGFDHRTLLRAEAGIILKTWAGETKVSTIPRAEAGARARALRSITNNGRASAYSGFLTINSGRRGGYPGQMWYRTKRKKFQSAGIMDPNGSSYRWSNIHFPAADWAAMSSAAAKASSALRTMIPMARQSIGLSRQSVVQIADALNIDLGSVAGGRLSGAGLAKARAALASSGRAHVNGAGRLSGDQVRAYAEMINRLPYNSKIGMDRTAAAILTRRAAFITRGYARGIFNSASSVARAFPNLIAVRAALPTS